MALVGGTVHVSGRIDAITLRLPLRVAVNRAFRTALHSDSGYLSRPRGVGKVI